MCLLALNVVQIFNRFSLLSLSPLSVHKLKSKIEFRGHALIFICTFRRRLQRISQKDKTPTNAWISNGKEGVTNNCGEPKSGAIKFGWRNPNLVKIRMAQKCGLKKTGLVKKIRNFIRIFLPPDFCFNTFYLNLGFIRVSFINHSYFSVSLSIKTTANNIVTVQRHLW